ncbi:MAG TPA: helix-turn-helix domain-containing protein [Chlorobiota bacterium]|nr:helix-turn-helix domain-containing protein [Chlorobiota bacterium]
MSEKKSKMIQIEGISIEEFLDMLNVRELQNRREYREYEASRALRYDPSESSSGNPEKLITDRQLAEMTGLTRQTLRKHRQEGRLRNVKNIEPKIRYTQEAVDEYLRGEK